jgi:sugar lactone lactonase YvrE
MRIRTVLLALTVTLGAASAQVPADRDAYDVPGDATFPEGIAYHESEHAFLVTGAGSGAIYRVDLATGEAATLLEPGLRGPFTTIGLAVDDEGRLWVAGGASGEILRFDDLEASAADYDATAGPSMVIAASDADATFVNDVVVAPNGDVFATDSYRPVLYRVPADTGEAEVFVDFDGTAFAYQDGFNANGIAITEDGRYLVVVASNTGRLYRIDVATRDVSEIALDVEPLIGGDGLVLAGHTLYVVQNGPDQVSVVTLSEDASEGRLERVIDDERFASAATAALVGDRLLVVNAQFAAMETGPELPFTVAVVPAH